MVEQSSDKLKPVMVRCGSGHTTWTVDIHTLHSELYKFPDLISTLCFVLGVACSQPSFTPVHS